MPSDLASWPAWYVAAVAALLALVVALAVHDARTQRIPNLVVYPALGAGLLLALASPVRPWWSGLAAGLFAGGLLVLLDVISHGGMGMGDAKLAALIGLLVGWPAILVALLVAFTFGAAVALVLLAAGRVGRRDAIPFGPALAVGALVGLTAGPALAATLWPVLA